MRQGLLFASLVSSWLAMPGPDEAAELLRTGRQQAPAETPQARGTSSLDGASPNQPRAPTLVPDGWDPALAGDQVLERLVTVTAPQVKGAHDAEFACVGDRAYVVAEVNDVRPGEGGGWPEIYCSLSLVNLATLTVERIIELARGEQVLGDVTLPRGACFVPRILQKDAHTLRCWFATEHPGQGQAQTWYRDFSREAALQTAGFTKVAVPEVQRFPGAIDRVGLYRKDVKAGERLRFAKMVRRIMDEGADVRLVGAAAALAPVDARTEPPVIITQPGPEFQDDARPGAMIIGMDRTPQGRIWGCWTGTGDKRDGYFILASSDDGGTTWSQPRLVVGALDPSGKRQRGALVGNLWTDPLGRLWLFFDQTVIGVPGPTANWFIRCDRPDADAPVWSQPVYLAEGCTLNKPTVLTNGDWLLPVSHWAEKTAWVYVSTDQGQAWKPRGSVKFPDWEFDEHMLVELRDGRLWMLARTKGNPHECFSSDQGRTWSVPQPARIQNVNARFFLRRLASGRLLLVKNGPTDRRLDKRSHLSAFLSDDDGQTWQGGLVLDERSSVSYPDGFEAPGGLIHILYDWNRHTDAEILLARFREEDILAGKLVSAEAKLQILANKATGPKPFLYNGIELPLEWPPRRLDPAATEPMPVPYLKNPPKVIPIDVGRQLFVDDFLIESTTLRRTFHTAQKHAANPVFKPETKHELAASTLGEQGQEAACYLGHGGLFYDPAEKHFQMFYTAGWRGPLALATSTDLTHWTRPNLGVVEDNLLLAKGRDAGGDNSLWLDLASPDARLKFLTDRGKEGHFLQTSADGRTWSPPVPTGAAGDYCSIFHNPFRNVWCYSIKQQGQHGRQRWYHESADFLPGADWSRSVFWANADRLDEPDPQIGDRPQLYSLSAVAYESLLLGMFQIHLGPDNRICAAGKFPKMTELKLGFSRDGFHWHRPDRRPFIAATRQEGDWDRAYLHTTTGVCVVLDDQLVFPYCAFSGIAPSGRRGMYTGGAIGLATLRRDGFASMDATGQPGTLTTRPVTFRGTELFVNLNAPQGALQVEVLDLSENPRVLATSKPLTADATRQRVAWTNRADLSGLAGKRVRFRFQLTNGQLYAFWISPDQSGVSNGYVGAGGPAYGGIRDDQRGSRRPDA